MQLSFLYISLPFSSFPRREMICFAVTWTTRLQISNFYCYLQTADTNSRILRTHFPSMMTCNNLGMITEIYFQMTFSLLSTLYLLKLRNEKCGEHVEVAHVVTARVARFLFSFSYFKEKVLWLWQILITCKGLLLVKESNLPRYTSQ